MTVTEAKATHEMRGDDHCVWCGAEEFETDHEPCVRESETRALELVEDEFTGPEFDTENWGEREDTWEEHYGDR